jgi:hypothetical protein
MSPGYLEEKISTGWCEAYRLMCPDSKCRRYVPVAFLARLVSPEMAQRCMELDLEEFVSNNPRLAWCPFPDCSRAVHRFYTP